MNNCKCNDHTNAFIDLDGIPYLLAEYVDKNHFMQIDKSLIRSDIFVDQSESMRAIIDISINDIGMNNGTITSVGNRTKQANLLKMISDNADLLNNQLDVIRGGLIVRVNYQLENNKTGQVIRSMCEDLRIPDRNYYLSINSKDVDDNAVIVNFNRSLVSTINEFTHGNDRMILRITNVQLFYECVRRSVKLPRIKDSMFSNGSANEPYARSTGFYDYHKEHQSHHIIGSPHCTSGNNYCDNDNSMMPRWTAFNRFYHFSDNATDIILHREEIYDPMNTVVLIPCGNVTVNRSFVINPGHRLIFKLSIWKNDLTIVNDTTNVAKSLNVPVIGDTSSSDDKCDCGCKEDNTKDQMILMMFNNMKSMIDQQNTIINRLVDTVNELQEKVENNKCDCNDKPKPEPTPNPDKCDCTCNEDHKEMNDKITELEGEIDDMKDHIGDGCDCEHIEPIPPERITELLKDI